MSVAGLVGADSSSSWPLETFQILRLPLNLPAFPSASVASLHQNINICYSKHHTLICKESCVISLPVVTLCEPVDYPGMWCHNSVAIHSTEQQSQKDKATFFICLFGICLKSLGRLVLVTLSILLILKRLYHNLSSF